MQYNFGAISNMFAVTIAQYMVDMATDLWGNQSLRVGCSERYSAGIEEYAIEVPSDAGNGGRYTLIRVDGLGNYEL
jgi:meiotically up-regulated gene 157 (Mug157) protein